MTESSRLGSVQKSSTSQRTRTRRDQNIDRRLREKVREAKARGNAYEGRQAPPVMVRGGMINPALPLRKSGKSTARRRYDVTLNVPGAEMRLPSLPQIKLDYRMISGILVAGLAFLLYYLWNTPTFRVDGATITGLQRLNSRDVNSVLDIGGEPVFAIDPQALVQKAREAFPEFSSISVQVSLPHEVQVSVEERQPILTWKQDGRTLLIDANGVAFPQRDLSGAAPALVVEASNSPPVLQRLGDADSNSMQFISVDMVSAILSMSAQAPKNTSLVYDSRHGLGWKDNRGWDVYFGDVRDIDMKLRIYQSIIKKIGKGEAKPALISVEYPYAPYYRLEK